MINRLEKLKGIKAKKVFNSTKVNFSFLSEDHNFPLVIKPNNTGLILNDWIVNHKEQFENKVKKHGAILFRGFHINSVEKFENFSKLYADVPLEYNLRSSPRYSVGKNVYHTTTYPKEYSIQMHSESSYAPNHPSNIVFCCVNPADERGETPIADNRLVLSYLNDDLKNRFSDKGVKYVRNLNKEVGLPWQEVFQTSNKEEVEEECKKTRIDFYWRSHNELVLTWNKKAIWEHPLTKELVWFNHGFFFNKYALEDILLEVVKTDDQLPNNTFFGDGSIISKEEIEEIRMAYKKTTIEFSWEKGDVLFLDNMLMSHGRNPYSGDRKIITSLF